MPNIHPSAIVDRHAELADDVRIDAYSIIGPGVTIGPGTEIYSHSIIQEATVMGANCKIGPAAYVGLDPQHLHFLSQPDRPQTWLVIGDRAIIRETAQLHRSTKPGRENATTVGNDCMLMGGSHVAHDCKLGNHVVLANGALLGGHCQVGDRVFLGGACGIHQFVRIGRLAIIGGLEAITRDIPPFAAARYGGLKGYNAIGCKRGGMSREAIAAIRRAYYCIHTHRTTSGIVAAIRQTVPMVPEIKEMLDFMALAKRGINPSVRFLSRPNDSNSEG